MIGRADIVVPRGGFGNLSPERKRRGGASRRLRSGLRLPNPLRGAPSSIQGTPLMDATLLESYRSYRDLPPLAGLATLAEAAQPGLAVEAAVTRLKRFH